MICKERDKLEHLDTDPFSQAGAKAEEQMAFYLKRVFRDDTQIWVFNDLRFVSDDGDVAQIDHLVLHRSGFILIESKSVTSKVRIHENGEWERLWNNHWQGMASPVKQVERQIDFLRLALNVEREKLLGKLILGTGQMGFRNVPFEVLVAISDRGSILREGEAREVVKADQVPDRVREIVRRHKKARGVLGLNLDLKSNDGLYNFKDREIKAISDWLMHYHNPRPTKADVPSPPAAPTVQETSASYAALSPATRSSPAGAEPLRQGMGKCQKCGGQSEILWGRYGYYWKCRACDANTPIKEYCPTCKSKMKLRKAKTRFFKFCEACHTESLYYQASV